jgi:hypothetical protein
MARSRVPILSLGWGFFIACRASHPLDHQTCIAQTPAVTHHARPVAAQGAYVVTCAHRGYPPTCAIATRQHARMKCLIAPQAPSRGCEPLRKTG